jgi:uncharacterized protein (TIGR00730 family)
MFAESARATGRVLAEAGIGLVYGGGRLGLMGLVADAAIEAGGEVIGVIPEFMVRKEVAHPGLTQLQIVQSMHERKAAMADCSDGFITLPGGLGTFDELAEVLSWAQLGLHTKPCGLVNVAGFFDAYLHQLDHALSTGFMRSEHRALVLVDQDPMALLNRMRAAPSAPVSKWSGTEVR